MAVSFVDEGAEMMEKSALDEKQLLLSGEVEMPDTLSYFSSDCCPLRNISLFMKTVFRFPWFSVFALAAFFKRLKRICLERTWNCTKAGDVPLLRLFSLPARININHA